MGNIIRDDMVDCAALKVARRKIDTIRNMHRNCAVLNFTKNLKIMRDDLQLTEIANICCYNVEASAVKREK